MTWTASSNAFLAGANDYISKPPTDRQSCARRSLKAELDRRQARTRVAPVPFELGQARHDLDRRVDRSVRRELAEAYLTADPAASERSRQAALGSTA
jgi:PleD family two-component response regulator